MEDDSARKSGSSQSSPVSPRDGFITFSGYSLQQLRELQHSVDKQAFPLNFSNLVAALKQKEEAETTQSVPQSATFTGQFTPRAGILGWLAAKARRSPLYGAGTVEPLATDILLHGWQRTWLGVPIETQRFGNSIGESTRLAISFPFDSMPNEMPLCDLPRQRSR